MRQHDKDCGASASCDNISPNSVLQKKPALRRGTHASTPLHDTHTPRKKSTLSYRDTRPFFGLIVAKRIFIHTLRTKRRHHLQNGRGVCRVTHVPCAQPRSVTLGDILNRF